MWPGRSSQATRPSKYVNASSESKTRVCYALAFTGDHGDLCRDGAKGSSTRALFLILDVVVTVSGCSLLGAEVVMGAQSWCMSAAS